MARYEFESVFADEIQNYINDKKSAGFVVLQIKLCSILQIIRSRFLLCYVNGNRLFGVDSALCFI